MTQKSVRAVSFPEVVGRRLESHRVSLGSGASSGAHTVVCLSSTDPLNVSGNRPPPRFKFASNMRNAVILQIHYSEML